jgi:hypothetical protein
MPHHRWIFPPTVRLRVVALACAANLLAVPSVSRGEEAVADFDGKQTAAMPAVIDYPLALIGPKPARITPPAADELQSSIERGVGFLLGAQRTSGAWGGPQRTKQLNIYAPGMASHLAFRTATTSLAIQALCESETLLTGGRRRKVEAAIERGQLWLLEHSDELRRAEPDSYVSAMGLALYNVWGHAFALQALAALHERARGDAALQEKLDELLRYHVHRLKRDAFVGGGWGYYDLLAHTQVPSDSSNSFVTATVLVALNRVQTLGVEFPPELLTKAVDSLMRQRYPDFSYAYGEYLRMMPRMDINRPGGSLGRSQACNLALRLYGDKAVTDAVLKTWLNRLFARNGWLSIGRKLPVPHESYFSVAGYFYYYGHYYAALCIEELPDGERGYFQDHLARILMPLQEKDGSWWDYPLYDYHQSWGTAMAVSALVRCRHGEP